ncbi:hypothetical protein [Desulfobacca acetoxidans]|uniref:Uncharacterized protein n=1 Tax=Desulfobacca acetoxidans (strain ATCC 700848 / DSM 11109 / ASRB2) TaxID=880072 RepID=F2NGN1_DESAR|nr:hypothetical protein [Desulfobacca acetoxidans]AEB07938.1 hypothetical protein Desac_0039 [Desulfobacca acetoxidans DSM 11109]
MSSKPKVEIIVYDAPTAVAATGCGCGCGCGDHDHGREHGPGHDHHHMHDDCLSKIGYDLQTQAMALTLEKAFPGQVSVEYINVLKDPRGSRLPQTALLCSLAYPTPLVYINGQGRFAGSVPVERIRDEVSKHLAVTTH